MFSISLGGAALAGLVSFVSPCILPIVPFYLSYLAGVSLGQAEAGTGRGRAVVASVVFSAGVIAVFVALGASASLIGQVMREYLDVLRWVAAALIGAMGLHFLGVLRIPLLYREWRVEAGEVRDLSLTGAFVMGLAFAFGWTPCVGPVLSAVLFTAASEASAARGAVLLLAYGLGMTLPFVLAAAFIGPFLRGASRLRRHLGAVEKGTGAMLVIFAILIATGGMTKLAEAMLRAFPAFNAIG
ncbi:MAG: cytochrome c biogenesis protein CcdA [Pseudomonadota bacterium]